MANPRYVQFTPKWMKDEEAFARLAHTPNTGIEPEFAPRLPIRLLPISGSKALSAITLVNTIDITQRIVTFSAQEAAHGPQYEFSDLRTVKPDIAELAKLLIEPFEPGSFVIPATLEERSIEIEHATTSNTTLSAPAILKRFSDAMEGVATDQAYPASIGLVSAVEELGKVIRREATAIEYYPSVLAGSPEVSPRIIVNDIYVDKVRRNLDHRMNVQYELDELSGLLIAVDVSKSTLKIRLSSKSEVRGVYERATGHTIVSCLNRAVTLKGIVGYKNGQPTSIRAYSCKGRDD